MEMISGGQGNVGPSDQTTPCTPNIAPFLSTEQLETRSATPPRPAEGATDADRRKTYYAKERVEAGFDTNVDVEAAFPESSCVTSTGSIVTTFLVNEEFVPIKIEKISGNYRLFNLVFIIFF